MCQNATKTVASILEAEEPNLKEILAIEGVSGTAAATTALNQFNQAITDLQNWTPGSPAQEAIEVLTDTEAAVTALGPLIPPADSILINTVLAGIVLAIGLVEGNSPAPVVEAHAAVASTTEAVPQPSVEEVQKDHERATLATYAVK